MINKIAHFFAHIPTALAGLALGIASLGWCWDNVFSLQGNAQMACASIASVLLISLFLKFILNFHLLKKDLSHPVSGSVVPTFTMASMVVANNIGHFNLNLAIILWLISICLHLLFLIIFIVYRVKNFKFTHILPSWFIPPVGIVVAVVSFPGGGGISFSGALFVLGFIAYVILLPTILYRYFLCEKIIDTAKPTIAVFAAPASLLLAGYLTMTEWPNYLFVVSLGGTAVLMTLFVYIQLFKLLRLPFTPAYSAFTFPLVISAIAMFKANHYLLVTGKGELLAEVVGYIAYGELILASSMVIYVCFCYLDNFILIGEGKK